MSAKIEFFSLHFTVGDSHRILIVNTSDFWLLTKGVVTLTASLTLEIGRGEYRS